jgi:hypothetical protein
MSEGAAVDQEAGLFSLSQRLNVAADSDNEQDTDEDSSDRESLFKTLNQRGVYN